MSFSLSATCSRWRETKGDILFRKREAASPPWRFTENGEEIEIAVEGRVVTNDGAVLVDAASEGLGLAYVFESMAAALVSRKQLVRVLDAHCPRVPGYFLYYPSRVNLSPRLRALVDFLKATGPRRGPGSTVSRPGPLARTRVNPLRRTE